MVTEEAWLSESWHFLSVTARSQRQSAAAAEHLPNCYHTAALTLCKWLIKHKQTLRHTHPDTPHYSPSCFRFPFFSSSASILPWILHLIWHSEDMSQFFFTQSMLTRMAKCFLGLKKKMCASEAKSQEVMKVDGCALSEIWGLVRWIQCFSFC